MLWRSSRKRLVGNRRALRASHVPNHDGVGASYPPALTRVDQRGNSVVTLAESGHILSSDAKRNGSVGSQSEHGTTSWQEHDLLRLPRCKSSKAQAYCRPISCRWELTRDKKQTRSGASVGPCTDHRRAREFCLFYGSVCILAHWSIMISYSVNYENKIKTARIDTHFVIPLCHSVRAHIELTRLL